MSRIVVGIAALAAVVAAGAAQAQEQQSFRSLISNGYEIKAVTVVPHEIAKRYADSTTTDTVLVTLQRQRNVAVCYFGFGSWVTLLTASIEDNTRCDVRVTR
jgi:hypothetical protein